MNEWESVDLKRQMRRIEELVQTLEQLADPAARTVARELFQTLLAFHQAGLRRLLEVIRRSESGSAIAAACECDDLVNGLLLLHGLHPVDLKTRVRQALEQLRPLLRCHGGDLELASVTDGRVRLRLLGSCSLSSVALEHALEEAFATTAPDAGVIEVEESAARSEHATSLLSLPLVP
jgi:Fe-S cluster biogenesis protein NfuA